MDHSMENGHSLDQHRVIRYDMAICYVMVNQAVVLMALLSLSLSASLSLVLPYHYHSYYF